MLFPGWPSITINDWNPNFIIERCAVQTPRRREPRDAVSRQWVMDVLEPLGQKDGYRSHDFPTPKKLKIYLDDGSVFINLKTGEGELETVALDGRCLYQVNRLHLSPRQAWLVFSDFFAVGLIIVSVTGLFVLKGKTGITGRGAIFATAGVLFPIIVVLYM